MKPEEGVIIKKLNAMKNRIRVLAVVFSIFLSYHYSCESQEIIEIRTIDQMEMVFVKEGSFKRGSSDKQIDQVIKDCYKMYPEGNYCNREVYARQEQPEKEVQIDAFWMDKTEVTNAQFCLFLNENGNQSTNGIQWFEPGYGHRGVVYGYIEEADGVYKPQEGYENYPVIEVSWYGAQAYCEWIGGRLPTEAEWEYAAKGPMNNIYPWGNDFDGTVVNYRDISFDFDNQGKDTSFSDSSPKWTEVGGYPEGASWCGVLDLAGNVHEWVYDWYAEGYYSVSPSSNPQGPERGDYKVCRGGSWYDPGWHVRGSYRKIISPSSARMHWVGFRCVISAEDVWVFECQ
jgi:formylglycine-generating enzyme required for sulfatase activity